MQAVGSRGATSEWTGWERIATPAGVPNQPTRLRHTATAAGADLTWTVPSDDGGSAILSYVWRRRAASGGAQWSAAMTLRGSPGTSASIQIPENTIWHVQVAAVNAAGTGLWSAQRSVQREGSDQVTAPTAGTVRRTGSVPGTHPGDPGTGPGLIVGPDTIDTGGADTVEAIEWRYRLQGTLLWQPVGSSVSQGIGAPFYVTLQPDVACAPGVYDIQHRTRTRTSDRTVLRSDWSPSTTQRVAQGLPGVPRNVRADHTVGSPIVVRWDPPGSGCDPDSYAIVLTSAAVNLSLSAAADARSVTFPAQLSGRYTVRVAAVIRAAGSGATSPAVTFDYLSATVPDAPTARPLVSTYVIVDTTTDIHAGAPAVNYTFTPPPAPTPHTAHEYEVSVNGVVRTILQETDLDTMEGAVFPPSAARVGVRARTRNAAGPSDWTSWAYVTALAPSGPVRNARSSQISVDRSDRRVEWSAPANTGGLPILRYEIIGIPARPSPILLIVALLGIVTAGGVGIAVGAIGNILPYVTTSLTGAGVFSFVAGGSTFIVVTSTAVTGTAIATSGALSASYLTYLTSIQDAKGSGRVVVKSTTATSVRFGTPAAEGQADAINWETFVIVPITAIGAGPAVEVDV